MLGVVAGLVTRSQSAGVVVVIAAFMVEKLLGGLADGAARYLPYGALQSVLQLDGAPLAPGVAATALAIATALLAVLAGRLLSRRDVA